MKKSMILIGIFGVVICPLVAAGGPTKTEDAKNWEELGPFIKQKVKLKPPTYEPPAPQPTRKPPKVAKPRVGPKTVPVKKPPRAKRPGPVRVKPAVNKPKPKPKPATGPVRRPKPIPAPVPFSKTPRPEPPVTSKTVELGKSIPPTRRKSPRVYRDPYFCPGGFRSLRECLYRAGHGVLAEVDETGLTCVAFVEANGPDDSASRVCRQRAATGWVWECVEFRRPSATAKYAVCTDDRYWRNRTTGFEGAVLDEVVPAVLHLEIFVSLDGKMVWGPTLAELYEDLRAAKSRPLAFMTHSGDDESHALRYIAHFLAQYRDVHSQSRHKPPEFLRSEGRRLVRRAIQLASGSGS